MSKKANPYAAYATNINLELEGVWLVEPSFRVKIARAGGSNERYNERFAALVKPHKRAIQLDRLSKEVDDDLMRILYADCVIMDWEVLDSEKSQPGKPVYKARIMHSFPSGEEVPFAKPEVMNVLANVHEFRRYLMAQANDVSIFQGQTDEETEADVKN